MASRNNLGTPLGKTNINSFVWLHLSILVTLSTERECVTGKFGSNVKCDYIIQGAGKFLVRPGRKQATAKEDFEFHISYL